MSRLLFTVNVMIIALLCSAAIAAGPSLQAEEKRSVVITSDTLTANSRDNTAVFEGSVVAKTDKVTMLADRMTVYYGGSGKKVNRIHASGNVKVYNNEKVIFSKEAVYFDEEDKIVFSGNPKAVEGKNVLTGRQITFHLNNNRTVVEGSRIILREDEGQR